MSSAMRHVVKEAALWLVVFTGALAAFMFLDDRIGHFLEWRTAATQAADETPAEPTVRSEPDTANAAAGQRDTEPEDDERPGRVILRAGPSGHFEVNAYINNRPIELLADTGATKVVLTWDDAWDLGITGRLKFNGRARTANGVSKIAFTTLDTVEVGDIRLYDVEAAVAERGALHKSLLGMSFIGRLERFEMSGRRLILEN